MRHGVKFSGYTKNVGHKHQKIKQRMGDKDGFLVNDGILFPNKQVVYKGTYPIENNKSNTRDQQFVPNIRKSSFALEKKRRY
jgi:hypothetical protein